MKSELAKLASRSGSARWPTRRRIGRIATSLAAVVGLDGDDLTTLRRAAELAKFDLQVADGGRG